VPEREMNPHGVEPEKSRKFTIAADAGETAIDIELPETLPKNKKPKDYKIVKKDVPQAAKDKSYGGKKVKWINNYGIRIKGNLKVKKGGNKQDPFIDEVAGEQFSYNVTVPGPPPAGFTTLVYFDGTNVQPTGATPDSGGNYRFSLNIGDPPTGWGG
jgi:hypothetical protein